MALALASGSPMRPNGCKAVDSLIETSFFVSASVGGMRVRPGATQLTRMF